MIGTVAGNYRIVEEIGVGGMGKVYRGIDLTLDREVAIKVLRPELMTKEQIVNRFRNEAMTLAKLNHPHIATLYSFFRHEEAFLMVLEFVRGERLDRRMARFGTLPPEDAIGIFRQILEAIAFAHKRGIIHRDLKPNNVMITEAEEVKVMDFGIARVVGTERMTQEGLLVGTIEYMAPEQIRGHDPSPQTDIYSLGIMLYEMMTSRLPFSCKSQYEMMRAHIELAPLPPSQFVPDIPPHVEEAMLKALAKEPAERFASVEHFHAALLGVDPATFAERPLRQTVQSRTLDPALRSLASDQFSSTSRSTPNTGAPTTPASGQHVQPVSAPGAAIPARPFYTRPAVLAGVAAALVLAIIAIVLALRPAPSVEPQPTPAPAARFQVDVVRIEGATFRMGRDTAPQRQGGEDFDWAAAEWPAHSMPVASFEIDRYEVTNEEYAMFVAETGTPAPRDWNGSQPPAGRQRWPVRNVTQIEAQLFAAWRSKRDGRIYRLPTEEEWEYAAHGGQGRQYPWGEEWTEGRSNVRSNGPQPVGSYNDGVSPFGVHDMLGNVGEWTSSFARYYPGSNRNVPPEERGMVVVRGGSFKSSPTGKFPIRVTSRGWFPPSQREETIGFRLVRELTKN
ncbi:MAG: SUMF1/EgtB/PvdO family nonheme iron enzyme [Acidobacteria bacterium]|nr:SUMF1/EgtB/PvdO family nonheme iron enzyme [Acidobacteriota bacterium]